MMPTRRASRYGGSLNCTSRRATLRLNVELQLNYGASLSPFSVPDALLTHCQIPSTVLSKTPNDASSESGIRIREQLDILLAD
jgi:hypothetical protein